MQYPECRPKHTTCRKPPIVIINRVIIFILVIWLAVAYRFMEVITIEARYKVRDFNRKYQLTEIYKVNEQDSDSRR